MNPYGLGTDQICNQADCPVATGFYEYTQGSGDGGLCWVGEAGECVPGQPTNITGENSLNLPFKLMVFLLVLTNTTVKWSFGNVHNVWQTNSSWQVPDAPEFASSYDTVSVGNTRTYVHQFTRAGVYYFFCSTHPSLMRGIITVVDPTSEFASSSSGSGNSNSSSSTGESSSSGGTISGSATATPASVLMLAFLILGAYIINDS